MPNKISLFISILFSTLIGVISSNSQTIWDYYGLAHIYNTNSGNVGIGDGNPFLATEKLEIFGNLKLSNGGGLKVDGRSYNLGSFSIGTDNNYNAMLNIYSGDINKIFLGGNAEYNRITFSEDQSDYSSYLDIKSSSDGYLNYTNNYLDRPSLFRINNNGNVGIGTFEPAYTLDVNGPVNATDILKNGQSIAHWSTGLFGNNIFYSNGNVGIGTDNPNSGLHVKNSTGQWKAWFEATDLNGTGIAFSDPNGLAWISYFGGSSGYMDFFNKFRITNNGNIGINNANPNYKLDVGGVINATDILKNGQALGQWSINGTNLYYNDGNIGIGTNNPLQKLDVNGTISVSSDPSAFPLRFSAIGNNDWGIEYTGVPNLDLIKQGNNTKNSKNGLNMFEWGMGLRIRDDGLNGFYIKDKVSGQYRMVINQGKIGIGTTTPSYTLDVNGTINATDILKNGQPLGTSQWTTIGSDVHYSLGKVGIQTTNFLLPLNVGGPVNETGIQLGNSPTITDNYHIISHNGYLQIFNGNHGSGTRLITFRNNGNVGIGVATYNSDAKLCVDGTIKSKEVIVTQNANDWLDWPDYVFEEGYELIALEEIEKYIKENKHLPGVDSQDEVKKDGIHLGQISTILLKKIEELTLYLIEQNKRIEELEANIK